MAAVEAGVRTIEHGTYLDDEACDAMREMGVILVPTRAIFEDILANLAAVPDYAAAKLTAVAGRHAEAVSRAIDRGVTIAMGTDISVTGQGRPNSWGTNGAELAHLVRLGMTPLQAIEAATTTAPLTLGPQAPKSGRLERGYDADVWHRMANELELTGMAIPEAYGGAGAGFTELGVETVILLGALLADSPHTRPVPVHVSGSNLRLLRGVGSEPSDYKGPSGIVGVLLAAEQLLLAVVGGGLGYAVGILMARLLGVRIFGFAPEPKLFVLVIILVLAAVTTLLGSALPLRRASRYDPAPILRGE